MSDAGRARVYAAGSTFVTWFFGGLGGTLGYLVMNLIWKKLVG